MYPDLGFVALKALPVALLGGMDSIIGVIPGALIIAAVEVAAMQYVDPLVSSVMPMIVLLLVVIVYPWGLFGTREEIERV